MASNIQQLLRCSRKCLLHPVLIKGSGHLRNESKGHKVPFNGISQYARTHCREGLTWLWEVNESVQGFNEAAKHGTRVFLIEYTFNSVRPLEPEDFHKTFDYVLRKFPNSRTVIREKGGSSWYCQLHNYKLDFKIMSNEDTFREDCLELLDSGFNESDTLPWRARLVPRGPDARCNIKGLLRTHPYQYDFSLLFNHAMSDGIDAINLSSCFLYALNCVVGDIPIGNKHYGTFENNTDFEALVHERKEELLQDPSSFAAIRESLPVLGNAPSMTQAFPRPNVIKTNSKYLLRTVDPNMMKGLLSKCNQMGVTFSSFAISVCNIALTELMEEAGVLRDVHELYTLIFMSTRRYQPKSNFLLGCHMTAMTYKSKSFNGMRYFFWEYCKQVHQDLHSFYDEKGLVFDQTAMQRILDGKHKTFNYTDNIRPVSHDYTSNYLGDITKLFTKDEHVKLTNFTILQKNHNYRNALVQEILTFKGRTQYNFLYANDYFSEETIGLIVDKIFHLFEVVGK